MHNRNRSLSFDCLEKRELMVVTGKVTFTLKPPQLGQLFQADLKYISSPNYNIAGTTWSQITTYKGFTTGPVPLTGSRLTADMVSDVPGSYKVTAITTYVSVNPSVPPPAATTVTGQIVIPAPTVAIKKTGQGQPTALNGSRQMTYSVTAGGEPVGQYFIGHIQENILPFKYWDGTPGGGHGWQPTNPSQQFNFNNSTINDQFAYSLNESEWEGLPVGTVIATFTQELRFTWMMSTPAMNQPESERITTFTWTWIKVDDLSWEAN